MSRRPFITAAAALFLLVAGFFAVVQRQRRPGAQPTGSDERRAVTALPREAAPVSSSKAERAAAADPPAPPTLRETFDRHVRQLRMRSDEEGVIGGSMEFAETIRFMKAHGAEFREEILRICLERGFSTGTDWLVGVLSEGLPKEEVLAHLERETRLQELIDPHKERKVNRGQILAQVIGDPKQPVGVRLDAVWQLTLTREAWSDPALAGQVLSLLDTVKEPLVRTWLFSQLLSGGEDAERIAPEVLERALMAVSSGNEKRGTLEVIVSRLSYYLAVPDQARGMNERFGARIEAALTACFLHEAGKATPDDLVVAKISRAMRQRESVASPEQVAQASELLASDRPPSVRLAAVSMLLPDLARRREHPDVRAHIAQCRPILLELLRKDANESLATEVVSGLAQWKDPETNRLLRELGQDCPHLREMIEGHLQKNAPRRSTPRASGPPK